MEDVYDVEKIWAGILAAMRVGVSGPAYGTYIRPTRLVEIKNEAGRLICTVGCTSGFVRDMLEQRYWGQLAMELEKVMGKKCEMVFKIQGSRLKIQEKEIVGPLFEPKKENGVIRKAGLGENNTFESYAVGGSNQMAFAAAQAVAKKPGKAYNPLFIYGGVGVGKTHLMQAIGHAVIENGETGVLFCSGEEFTNDLIEAIRFKTTEKVRAKYRKVKMLLIDDVQFIAGKQTIQEDFFHTFNAIQKEGGQVVMTSDKPPAEISKLEERLRSRFGAGLIVDIGQPDSDLRTAILLIKAKLREINLPMDAAQAVAQHVEGVRELEGFLMRLSTEARVEKTEITRELALRILKLKSDRNGRKIVTPTEVINLVGNYFDVGVQQLKGERRTKTLAWPRQIAMFLLRVELQLPYEEIGRLIGGRDHTTVMYAESKVQKRIEDDVITRGQVGELKRRLLVSS